MKIQTILLLALWATAVWGQSAQKGQVVDRGGALYTTGAVGSMAFGDNRYCAKGDFPAFGATYDGPAQLPIACFYTGTDGTPSGLHTDGGAAVTWQVRSDTDTTRCLPGPPDNGQCAVNDWNAALFGVQCGDTILLEHGAVITGTFVLPGLSCDAAHWVRVESDSVVTDASFPAEGTRATPCHLGLTSLANYPDYPCGAAHGSVGVGPAAANRMATFITATVNQPAIQLNGCIVFPCSNFWRFIGIEITNAAGVRIGAKLLSFSGGDHIILDRSIVHGQDDPGFNKTSEVQGGVNIDGSYIGVIDSWIYDTFCTNANIGPSCVDSQGISGGVGPYPQKAHKIVNNLVASSGESWFWGGGQQAYLPTANNPDGVTTDVEVRRNHSFKPLTWMLTVCGGACGSNAHWDPKNLGETKATNRSIWEANVEENSWTGWQSDQFGNANLATPKSQSSKVGAGSFSGNARSVVGYNCTNPDGITGCGSGAHHFVKCVTGTGSGVDCGAGNGNFDCQLDPNAMPGTGITTASCASMVAFQGLAGSYNKICPAQEGGMCRFLISTGSNGIRSDHIVAVPSSEILELDTDESGLNTATTYSFCKRGADQFAVVRNLTMRNTLIRHVTDVFEIFSAGSDCGDDALGVHNVSVHDIVAYDVDATFWNNSGSPCCTLGWVVKLESSTLVTTAVPSDITVDHNSVALIGFNSNFQGLANWFDQKYISGTGGPAYFLDIKFRNNITAASISTSRAGGYVPGGQYGGAQLFGCPQPSGTCTYDLRKNLLLTGLWANQNDNPPNVASGGGAVDVCSATGTPSLDMCDRAVTHGYSDVFTTWDVNGTNAMDLRLPAGSQYLGQATDGGNLGADVATVINTWTAGVATATSFPTLSITTASLLSGTNGTAYSQQVIPTTGASPFKIWELLAGALPTGLSLAVGDGTISGTPTATGTFPFTVQVEDAGHQFATRALSIQVN